MIHNSSTSLYIHIPFCRKKCHFCSFVVTIGKESFIEDYLACLAREASRNRGERIKSVYIGGGTPSVLSAQQAERLFGLIRENFQIEEKAEWTIEANPDDIEHELAESWLRQGVNRVSLGVQSLNDKYLKQLGRIHDSRKAVEAFKALRSAGFKNISIDMMYSFPGQTLEELQDDIKGFADLGGDHLSCYALTIEDGTKFFHNNISLDENETLKGQYLAIEKNASLFGFKQYEISNFSREGKESLHNRHYWEGGNYIGLGIGAHSHCDGQRWMNTSNLTKYLSSVKENLNVAESKEVLPKDKRLAETLCFGLRMNDGIDLKSLENRFGVPLTLEQNHFIAECISGGLLVQENIRLKATPRGRLVLDEISARLI